MKNISKSSFFLILRNLLNRSFLTNALLIAFGYVLVTLFASQYKVLLNIFSQHTSLLFKLKISGEYLVSVLTIYKPITLVLFFLVALLVGTNIMFAILKLKQLNTNKDLKLTFGMGLLSLSSAGCPSCGFSLLSLTGISAASLIPLTTFDLALISLAVLVATTIYNVYSLQKISCALPTFGKKRK